MGAAVGSEASTRTADLATLSNRELKMVIANHQAIESPGALKAAAEYGVDLRNHDSDYTWDKGFADN